MHLVTRRLRNFNSMSVDRLYCSAFSFGPEAFRTNFSNRFKPLVSSVSEMKLLPGCEFECRFEMVVKHLVNFDCQHDRGLLQHMFVQPTKDGDEFGS